MRCRPSRSADEPSPFLPPNWRQEASKRLTRGLGPWALLGPISLHGARVQGKALPLLRGPTGQGRRRAATYLASYPSDSARIAKNRSCWPFQFSRCSGAEQKTGIRVGHSHLIERTTVLTPVKRWVLAMLAPKRALRVAPVPPRRRGAFDLRSAPC
jgi:hypothetical protein